MDGNSPPKILHFAETGSTNADAMRLALEGEALPFWVTADVQTGGRGRSGRQWISQPGNLHASLAIRCNAPKDKAGQLSLLAGISLMDAVLATMDLAPEAELRLKWPNDLLIGVAKVGGILIESTTLRDGSGILAILGFGLNLVAFPDAIGRQVTALARHGTPPEPRMLLSALSERLFFWLDRWNGASGFDAIRAAWIERAGPVGEAIAVNTAAGPLSAAYKGISETGALLVEIDGGTREFNYGDVTLVGELTRDGDT